MKKENTLLCYSFSKHADELIEKINEYKDTNVYLILHRNIEVKFFKNNELDGLENPNCIIDIFRVDEFIAGELDKVKFNHIVENPPYSIPVGPDKTDVIWDKIVLKSLELLKDNGDAHLIHPGAAWRFNYTDVKNNMTKIKELYRKYNMYYLETHSKKDGQKTFNATTDYDVISLIKKESTKKSIIKTKSDGEVKLDLSDYDMIPTDSILLYDKLRAKDGEERVDVLFSNSAYESRKKYVSSEKDSEFKYPVVYTMTIKDGVTFWYSSDNTKGHFGIPKLILKKGVTIMLLDLNGDYGMTQFAAAIVDSKENLPLIQQAMETKEFKKMQADFTGSSDYNMALDGKGHMIKFIKTLRKDFWKNFI